jgi:hypothetical protein
MIPWEGRRTAMHHPDVYEAFSKGVVVTPLFLLLGAYFWNPHPPPPALRCSSCTAVWTQI